MEVGGNYGAKSDQPVEAIVAMAENRAIGRGNDLPWHVPEDLKHFKRTTLGHTLIMGRKTFETCGGKPLPERRNIVVTRQARLESVGIETAHSLPEALKLAGGDGRTVFIAGGEQIYRQALEYGLINRIHLTVIHTRVDDADAFFPPLDESAWQRISEHYHEADENSPFACTFEVYERRMK